ncbi:MAG: hypothetical protein KJ799_06635 [Bacteroidetes bacterium]|nr:hypothetical protein [Bacteroidota bacterium]MBU1677801.1 hypothetical protein [Bacteroidota bacterium]MBU2506385.1 hypothetical protein [Bacteroidota bacterium]
MKSVEVSCSDINSGNEGWGVIKPLSSNSIYSGTMTGEFFACVFSVSDTATAGDIVTFNLHLSAEGYENDLDLSFDITID